MTEVPHFALPLRAHQGSLVVVEQDSPQQIADCVEAACRTEEGWRVEAPEFGIPAFLLRSGGVDVDELRAGLTRSEPRASVIVDRVEPDDLADDGRRAERIRILIDEGT